MSETATIVTSIIGTGAAIVAITAAMLRILSTNPFWILQKPQ